MKLNWRWSWLSYINEFSFLAFSFQHFGHEVFCESNTLIWTNCVCQRLSDNPNCSGLQWAAALAVVCMMSCCLWCYGCQPRPCPLLLLGFWLWLSLSESPHVTRWLLGLWLSPLYSVWCGIRRQSRNSRGMHFLVQFAAFQEISGNIHTLSWNLTTQPPHWRGGWEIASFNWMCCPIWYN